MQITECIMARVKIRNYEGMQTFWVLPEMTPDVIVGVNFLPPNTHVRQGWKREQGANTARPHITALASAEKDEHSKFGIKTCTEEQRMQLQEIIEPLLLKFTDIKDPTHLKTSHQNKRRARTGETTISHTRPCHEGNYRCRDRQYVKRGIYRARTKPMEFRDSTGKEKKTENTDFALISGKSMK